MALIEIYTEELPPDWRWHPTDQFKTGTTEFYIETAKWLTKFGHDVFVYYDGEYHEADGVAYWPRSGLNGQDILLSCNSKPYKMARRNVYWTNLFTDRARDYDWPDAVVTLSQYHRKLFGGNAVVVGHGCYPERYKNSVKIPKLCLYSSSPDRGGDFLKEIWPEVNKQTGAELITTYDKGLPENVMDDLYRSSQFWLHPGQGVELFCISALKAQAASCIPVVVPNMALAETVRTGVKTTKENFQKDLIEAINNPPAIDAVKIPSWEEQTRELEKVLLSG